MTGSNVVALFPRRKRIRDEAFWLNYLRRPPSRRSRVTEKLDTKTEIALRRAAEQLGPEKEREASELVWAGREAEKAREKTWLEEVEEWLSKLQRDLSATPARPRRFNGMDQATHAYRSIARELLARYVGQAEFGAGYVEEAWTIVEAYVAGRALDADSRPVRPHRYGKTFGEIVEYFDELTYERPKRTARAAQ